ncbi:hypothetical protein QJS04_geneDACA004284 [Acorus gramineus]|uniref:C2 domain-containing protein n=2 Tax=Acorus gramineus TaxID=55184 RepID=A0AAV9B0V2_ACOGR|nr:hypothetical protein QJS04_geneDACA004284 [Acorus gramineus]
MAPTAAGREPYDAAATLDLTLHAAEDLKHVRTAATLLGRKSQPFAVAWVDPRLKRRSKPLPTNPRNPSIPEKLSFPLSLQALQSPTTSLTVQLLSPPSPIAGPRVIGTAVLPISAINAEEELALQLWRPSGRAQGMLRVSVRITYNVGWMSPLPTLKNCVDGVPVGGDPNGWVGLVDVEPSAPPLPSWDGGERVRRSALIGFISGAFAAAVMVGVSVL